MYILWKVEKDENTSTTESFIHLFIHNKHTHILYINEAHTHILKNPRTETETSTNNNAKTILFKSFLSL